MAMQQLCREDLDMDDGQLFRALDGYLKIATRHALLGCGVAEQKTIEPKRIRVGFGKQLWPTMCMAASAAVMASSSVQHIAETTFKQRIGATVDL